MEQLGSCEGCVARDVAAHALMNVTDADVFLGAVRTTKCTKKRETGNATTGTFSLSG